MGFNTTVVILNDGLNEIEANPIQFVDNLVQAIRSQWGGKERPIQVACGNHSGCALVVEQHHADYTHMILVGGNSATDIGYVGNANHHEPIEQRQMLKRGKENIQDKIETEWKETISRDIVKKEAKPKKKTKGKSQTAGWIEVIRRQNEQS